MKRLLWQLPCVLATLCMLCLCGCSSDDGPGMPKDYSNLRLGRMDLSGAVSLGLKKANASSRAIDGEYLSAGLYKIDANGNISAVGVYFTTDAEGNRLEHEEYLRIDPYMLFNLTDNYFLVAGCDYYDSDGDVVGDKTDYDEVGNSYLIPQDVPYKHLLVRKSDGKIWCVDNIFEMLIDTSYSWKLAGSFREDSHGTLYFNDNRNAAVVYKFNLNDADASFEQITTGKCPHNSFWRIADNGVVWGTNDAGMNMADFVFAWPYSGWQEMDSVEIYEDIRDDFVRDIPDFEYEHPYYYGKEKLKNFRAILHKVVPYFAGIGNNKPVVFLNNIVRIQAQREGEDEFDFVQSSEFRIPDSDDYADAYWQLMDLLDSNMPVALLYDISIGDTPGTAKLSNSPIELMPQEKAGFDWIDWDCYCYDYNFGCVQSVYIGDDFILTSDNNDKSWITLVDLKTREWRWLKQLDFKVDFSASLSYEYVHSSSAAFSYEGRIWAVDSSSEHFGAWWFDLGSLEDGFVKFNVTLPDFINGYYFESDNGKIIFSGVNPANGNTEKVIVGIMTGEAVTEVTEPELLFETLISLN